MFVATAQTESGGDLTYQQRVVSQLLTETAGPSDFERLPRAELSEHCHSGPFCM